MTNFKQELQKLINEAAQKHTNGFDTIDFKAGCEFLMPLIEMSAKQTEFYIREYHKVYYGIKSEEKLVNEHILDCRDVLLEQLRDDK